MPSSADRPPPDVQMTFDHDVAAPSRARHALQPLFPGDGPIADDVTLVASELVANVIRHTDNGGEMRAWNDEVVRVEVHDDDPRVPVPATAASPVADTNDLGAPEELDTVGGRGLAIVDQLADDWGTEVEPVGKTVWAEFGSRPD